MAGIFQAMNNPGTGELERTVPPSFLNGLFMMKVAEIRSNAQLLGLLETQLGRAATPDEISDLQAIATFIEAGTGEAGKVARLQRIKAVADIWETGQGGISEAEARAMMGAFA